MYQNDPTLDTAAATHKNIHKERSSSYLYYVQQCVVKPQKWIKKEGKAQKPERERDRGRKLIYPRGGFTLPQGRRVSK